MGSSDHHAKVSERSAAIPLSLSCPAPIRATPRILLAHGGGGRMSQQLFEQVFLPAFGNTELQRRHDGALLDLAALCPDVPIGQLAISTDGHVVSPLFFPGGDIGSLSVFGTVNDLAMCGARPIALAAAFILEEGLEFSILERVVQSMARAAREADVQIVTGDTKVVERGKGDGIFITTTGVGIRDPRLPTPLPTRLQPGDAILISGDLGRHGMAILAGREGLAFETPIESDCACLLAPVQALLLGGIAVHCLRDLTRGGLTSALTELAQAAGVGMRIDDQKIPIAEHVNAACEVLGIDPLHVACEGRFVCFVPAEQAGQAIEILSQQCVSAGAVQIGTVLPGPKPWVRLKTLSGAERLLDMMSGEQLPRIC